MKYLPLALILAVPLVVTIATVIAIINTTP
jgi:hypothetical protein